MPMIRWPPHLAGLELAPFLLLAGLGQGLGMSPLVGTVIAGLKPEEAGAGAGIVTTTLQVGSALGIALISLLFSALKAEGPGDAYVSAFSATAPAAALLLLFAALLVRGLPRTSYEATNALLERLPGWSTGFAYSMFLMTGGRAGDHLFRDILGRVAERRVLRTHLAPKSPGEFLAFHFRAGEADTAWLHYLMREALVYGTRTVPHEQERKPVIAAQVAEISERQALGLLPPDLDPALLRLLAFALGSYPRLLPQITRMTTGTGPDDPQFIARWESLLRRIGADLEEAGHRGAG
jgi:hypothetical protein